MAKKKRNGRRRGMSGWIDKVFYGLGLLVALAPAIEVGVNDVTSGNFQSIPNDVLFAYTGLGGSTPINTSQTLRGIGAVAGGGIVASIPRIFRLAKRIFGGR
jgi:hypothetical protein